MAISKVRSLLSLSNGIRHTVSSIYRFYSSNSATHFEVSVFFFFFLSRLFLGALFSETTQSSFTKQILSWVSKKIDGLVLWVSEKIDGVVLCNSFLFFWGVVWLPENG